jgi:phosphoribosyl 1,2-cyclic phosphate phosphodiesterase
VKGTLTVLGSGTSMGVPTIGCQCAVCQSTDPHDKRTRPSVMVEFVDASGHPRIILIDTSPDFRAQALRENIRRVDAVLFTHAHADHILGLDDIRAYNFHQRAHIPVYGNAPALDTIRKTFHYIFDAEPAPSAIPLIDIHEVHGPIELFGATFTPVPVFHGKLQVLGYRFGRNAYLTDFNVIPETSQALLQGLDILFLDALRDSFHATHCTIADALGYARTLHPKAAYFTHMNHEVSHTAVSARLPAGVFLSYDGLKLPVEL